MWTPHDLARSPPPFRRPSFWRAYLWAPDSDVELPRVEIRVPVGPYALGVRTGGAMGEGWSSCGLSLLHVPSGWTGEIGWRDLASPVANTFRTAEVDAIAGDRADVRVLLLPFTGLAHGEDPADYVTLAVVALEELGVTDGAALVRAVLAGSSVGWVPHPERGWVATGDPSYSFRDAAHDAFPWVLFADLVAHARGDAPADPAAIDAELARLPRPSPAAPEDSAAWAAALDAWNRAVGGSAADLRACVQALDEVIRVDPVREAEAWWRSGTALCELAERLGDHADADAALDDAAARFARSAPRTADVDARWAWALHLRATRELGGDPLAAARRWKDAAHRLSLAIRGGDPPLADWHHDLVGYHLARRRALIAAGRDPEARSAAKIALAAAEAGKGSAGLGHACALVACGRAEDALVALEATVAADPDLRVADVAADPELATLAGRPGFDVVIAALGARR